MKKIFKLVIITMVTILGCSLYNFTYANEEDGRLVDIPVPPSSTGQAGFTVEESKNQEEHYSEQANNKYEFNYNKEIEEEQKREEQTENKVTDTISDITEKNNEISNTNINQNINEITKKCHLELKEVSSRLTMLELDEKIVKLPGNMYIRGDLD